MLQEYNLMQFFNESFWLAVCFTIFIYLAYRPLKKNLLKLLDSKVEDIRLKIAEAENLKQQAELLLAKTQEEIAHFNSLKNEVLATTNKEVEELTKQYNYNATNELNYKKSQVIDLIHDKQEETIKNIKYEFITLTTKLVEEYFKTTNNKNLSDIKIAQRLKKETQESTMI